MHRVDLFNTFSGNKIMNHQTIFWQAFKMLRYMFIPFLVLILAATLFDNIGFNLVTLSESVANSLTLEDSAFYRLQESQARILWAITVLLYFALSIYLLVFGCYVLITSVPIDIRIIYMSLIGVCMIAAPFFLKNNIEQNQPITVIFSYTFNLLTASNYYSSVQLDIIYALLFAINSLALIIPMVCGITGCAIIYYCKTKNINDLYSLSKSAQTLAQLLNISSLMMVVGIIHMSIWLHWPAALVTDLMLSKMMIHFSSAISLYWGVTYSLMIITFYIPLTHLLNHHAHILITDCKDTAITCNPLEWLKKNHLSFATIEQLPRIVIMLAPVLAGPAGGLFTEIVQL